MKSGGIRRMLAALCSALFLASCGGGGSSDGSSGGNSFTNSIADTGLLTSGSRDVNGDVQINDVDFVMEAEAGDWLFKVRGFPNNFNFHLYIPETYKNNTDQAYPLLIHLHGDDGYPEVLNALTLVRPLGGSGLAPLLSGTQLNPAGRSAINKHVRDSFVVAPEVPHIDRTGRYAEPLGYWNPNAIKKIIAFVQAKYRIDSKRIYVTGMSFGGGGTWHVTNRSTSLVAAAVPICGGYDQPLVMYGIPVWVFQSFDDTVVPYQASLSVFTTLVGPAAPFASYPPGAKASATNYTYNYSRSDSVGAWTEGDRTISGNYHYTMFATGGHNAWDRAYANDVMWDWLYAQRKPQ